MGSSNDNDPPTLSSTYEDFASAARRTTGIMSGLLAVVALLFVSAFMFCTSGHRPDQTASNNTPSAAGGRVAPGARAPGPTRTAPIKAATNGRIPQT
jgi:hypothetical protein